MYLLSEVSKNKLKGVHPKLVQVFELSVKESPYDFRIVEGLRSAAYQNSLYQQGRSRKGKIITNCDGYKNKSNHQAKADGYGHAVDIFVCGVAENGRYVKFTTEQGYEFGKLKAVAEHILKVSAGLNIKVEWGGDWKKFKDYPHFELKM